LKRFRRTDFHIRVGRVFKISFPEGKLDRDMRVQMVDEIMYQLASLLPPEYRGYYADYTKLSTNYINFV